MSLDFCMMIPKSGYGVKKFSQNSLVVNENFRTTKQTKEKNTESVSRGPRDFRKKGRCGKGRGKTWRILVRT